MDFFNAPTPAPVIEVAVEKKTFSQIFKYLFSWSQMKKQPDESTACRDLPGSLELWRYFEVIYTHLFHVVPAHNPFLPPLEPRRNKAPTNKKKKKKK